MIRNLLVLSLALSSLSAMATPKVGDYALFDAVMTQNLKPVSFLLSMELTAYDAAQKKYQQKQVITVNGKAQEQSDWVAVDDLTSDAAIDSLLSDCVNQGGKAESITVATASIPTCAFPQDTADEKGTVWVGKVPFGLVKIDTVYKADNRHLVATLKSFH